MVIKRIFSTIKYHEAFLSLEKRVTLFSYRSSSSCTLFREGLDIGLHCLPSPIQQAPHKIQIFKQNKF